MQKRKNYLNRPTRPVDVSADKKISNLLEEMRYIGFQGRKLAEAIDVWTNMLKNENIVIWFGLAGAMVPAGMRKIVSYFIKRRMIDVLVSTGANLYHDVCETLGVKHYVGTHLVNDVELRDLRVDRIYDVFANEREYFEIDDFLTEEFCTDCLKSNYPYSSREILYLLGKYLDETRISKDKNSILVSASKSGVPVFAPALNDSMIGADIMSASRPLKDGSTSRKKKIRDKPKLIKKKEIVLNAIRDVDETTRITEAAKTSGVIYIGGGTPKNFINQTAVMASFLTKDIKSHSYAVQITADVPEWGGLSGCTFEEAQSWGKITPNATKVMCHCDATIALPIIAHGLSERFRRLERNVPIFEWKNGKLNAFNLAFEKRSL